MKEITKEYLLENIEEMEITEPIKIKDEDLVFIPYEMYKKYLTIINPEELKKIEEAIKNFKGN